MGQLCGAAADKAAAFSASSSSWEDSRFNMSDVNLIFGPIKSKSRSIFSLGF